MIKKSFIFLIFLLLNHSLAFSDLNIVSRIDGEIITNQDIKKEIYYLKILNPNLNQLNIEQLTNISKKSLINEIIKKKEIIKFIDINKENKFLNNYIEDLISNLNLQSIQQFEEKLINNRTYSIEQFKKKINIELYWNELIYSKYRSQIKIDENKIKNQLNDLENKQEEYLLSEIIFKKDSKDKIEEEIKKIKLSIMEIGFNNTANIFSISDSSKTGGKLGWISKNALSKKIFEEIEKINNGENTEIIDFGNNFLILKKEDTRIISAEIDKQKELNKLVQQETNNQLNRYSRIFFEKSKMNYVITDE